MKVVILEPKLIDIPESAEIPAGVMSVVPSISERPNEIELPDFTIVSTGQFLMRDFYPELQEQYPSTGGLYQFQLPELERKFLLGFDENKNPILGDGIIYFQSYPQRVLG